MRPTGTVLSVNIGSPRPNPHKRTGTTGFDTQPVEHPVRISAPGPKGTGERASGLQGDTIGDRANHGGDHQAVYAYAREDLDTWEGRLGRTLPSGSSFGENLTTRGIDVNAALIGDRWQLGDPATGPLLEVSCARIPCATFAGRMAEPGWLKTFLDAGLPGAYLRVIRPGEVRAGDPLAVVYRPEHEVTAALVSRAFTREPDLLPALLAAEALPEEERELARRRTGFTIG